MNIISTKIELFLIRCEINLAIQVPNVRQIIIITDGISSTRYIFDSSNYSFQLHLRAFFNKNFNNTILFWNCLSSDKWPPHLTVDKKTNVVATTSHKTNNITKIKNIL